MFPVLSLKDCFPYVRRWAVPEDASIPDKLMCSQLAAILESLDYAPVLTGPEGESFREWGACLSNCQISYLRNEGLFPIQFILTAAAEKANENESLTNTLTCLWRPHLTLLKSDESPDCHLDEYEAALILSMDDSVSPMDVVLAQTTDSDV